MLNENKILKKWQRIKHLCELEGILSWMRTHDHQVNKPIGQSLKAVLRFSFRTKAGLKLISSEVQRNLRLRSSARRGLTYSAVIKRGGQTSLEVRCERGSERESGVESERASEREGG